MTDVFDDLAVQMAEQPGPKAETVDVIRGRLLAAMREAADDRPTRARGGTAHGRVSAVPERARFALSVAVIVVLAVAVFVVPLPQLFHFGPGARANKLVPAGKVANGPGGVSVARMLAGHWSQMPPAPVAPRAQDVVVWTGKELIVWGGTTVQDSASLYGSGAAYDPATNSWRMLPRGPLSPRADASGVWTGSELVIFGGYERSANGKSFPATNQAAAYDPSTDRWRMLASAPLAPRYSAVALWTGKEVLVLGGTSPSASQYGDGAALDPGTGKWSHIAAPVPPSGHQLDWQLATHAGGEILAFSFWSERKALGGGSYSMSGGADLFSYSLGSGSWTLTPARANSVPGPEEAVWTGRVLVVRGAPYNCGACPGPLTAEITDLYDPGTNTWTPSRQTPSAATTAPASPGREERSSPSRPTAVSPTPRAGPASTTCQRDAGACSERLAPGATTHPTPVWTGAKILIYCPDAQSGGLVYTPAPAQHLALAGFDPLAFTAAGSKDLWALGSVTCDQSWCPPVQVPAILRTTDGGAHFERVGAPRAGIDVVSKGFKDLGIFFADASHGWVYGPGLYSSDNGGATWTNQHPPGVVTDVAATDGEVYALLCPGGLEACTSKANTEELIRESVSGGRWQVVSLPVGLHWDSSLSVHGSTLVLMNGLSSQAATVVVSTDGGRSFSVERSPCLPGFSGTVYAALDGAGVLWASCPTGMMAEAARSDDYGRSWQVVQPETSDNGLVIAPLSASTALLWPGPPDLGLDLTSDGGRILRQVFKGESATGDGPGWQTVSAQFASASRAYVLERPSDRASAAELWSSDDGGASWAEVPFSS